MATATKAYTLINLPTAGGGHQHVVQKTYVGTTHIYCLQQFDNSTNTYITQGNIVPGQTTVDFSQGETMTLANTGHAQTLDWYQHDGKDYFLIATYPKDTGGTEWATQLARVQFQAGPVDPASLDHLSWLDHANKSGTGLGDMERVEAAISTSRQYLLILGIRAGDHHAQLTYYNLEGVNNALDASVASGATSLRCDSSAMKAQAIDTWPMDYNIYGKVGNGSVQGMDFSDGLAVYFSGGAIGKAPSVTKVAWKSTNFRPLYFTGDWGPNQETEGIQVKDTLYLGIATHANDLKGDANYTTGNYVYTVDKGNW